MNDFPGFDICIKTYRTEQNRTEQNRTEQNRSDSKELPGVNKAPYRIFSDTF